MRKKANPKTEPVVSPEILENAKRSVLTDRLSKKSDRCVVCGADASIELTADPSGDPPEKLCWVCRRLKISAWRDVEQQMPAQE
jgi:hypothetical protein